MQLDMPRNFRVYLKDKTVIATTKEDARRILEERNKAGSRLIDIKDEKGNYAYSVDKHDVVKVERLERKGTPQGRYVCDFGKRHELGHDCVCYNDFKNMSGIKFWRIAKEAGHRLRYNEDITDEVRASVHAWIKETGYDNTQLKPRTIKQASVDSILQSF